MREPLKLLLTSAPVRLPVGLDEIRAHLRLDDGAVAEDAAVMGMVRAAVGACERFTGRALISQSWALFLDHWPAAHDDGPLGEGWSRGPDTVTAVRTLNLPKPPLRSIAQIKTFDESDNAIVWPGANYFVDTASAPGRVAARTGQTFPQPGRATNGIEIDFVAGYGDDPGTVPEDLRQGILRLAAHMFEHRGDGVAAAVRGAGAAALWQPYKVQSL